MKKLKELHELVTDLDSLGYPVCTFLLVGGSLSFVAGVSIGAWF